MTELFELKDLSFKAILNLIANCCGAGILAFMWLNFLINPWPSPSPNLIWDVLFVRTGGPLLYGNHVSSCMAILGVTTYFVFKQPGHIARWLFVIFSTAAMHEFMLDLWGSFLPGGYFWMNLRWEAWLSFILVGGLILATWPQRMRLVYIAAFTCAYQAAWIGSILLFHYPYLSLVGYSPGPALMSPLENSIEVASWIVPSLIWFYPNRLWIGSKQMGKMSSVANEYLPNTNVFNPLSVIMGVDLKNGLSSPEANPTS